MKTFQEFLEEGKKKEFEKGVEKIRARVGKSLKQQRKENPDKPTVADYGNPSLGSDEHMQAIEAMERDRKEGLKKMKKKFKAMQQNQQNDND